MLEDTTIHNAITDKALSSYFRSSGNLLEEESAVLGQAAVSYPQLTLPTIYSV